MPGNESYGGGRRETVGRRPAFLRDAGAGEANPIASAVASLLDVARTVAGRTEVEFARAQEAIGERRAAAMGRRDRALAVERNRATQRMIEARDAVRVAASDLCVDVLSGRHAVWPPAPAGQMDFAGFVTIGTVEVAQAQAKITNEPLQVPWVAPLLSSGNIIFDAPRSDGRALSILNEVAAAVLAVSGPGQLAVTAVDPLVRGVCAPLADLRQGSDDLLRPAATEPDQILQVLKLIGQDVQRITELFRGRSMSLADLRHETGQPIEQYRLVVIADYPNGFDETAHQRLRSLMETAPRCGVSFVIHRCAPAEAQPLGVDVKDLDASALVLAPGRPPRGPGAPPSSSFRWVPPDVAEPDRLAALSRSVGAAAGSAAAPSIPFEEIHSDLPKWQASSDAGLLIRIGRAGHEPIDLLIGDERDQRHNILISGAVGQGKSNLLLVMLHSLAWRYPPSEVEMYLLDLKDGMTLAPLAVAGSTLPHARVIGVQSDREYASAVLAHLVEEFGRRADVMKQYGDNVQKFRAARPEVPMPRIVLAIDEFQTLFDEDDRIASTALANLERLAKKGRAYGIHVILGTQTLSGITQMLTKQDSIFSQFPIRIALKNSAAESRVVLDVHNDEASRLRFRGEAILNQDFGLIDANRRVVIAYAAQEFLSTLRSEMAHDFAATPEVYDGRSALTLRADLDARLAEEGADRRSAVDAMFGRYVAVGAQPVVAELRPEGGRHVAIVGSGKQVGPVGVEVDVASGVLMSAVLTIAVSHGNEPVSVVVLDGLSADERVACGFDGFISALGRLGCDVMVSEGASGSDALAALVESIPGRTAESVPTIVASFASDRHSWLRRSYDGTASALDLFHRVLLDGPPVAVHVLGAWTNLRSHTDHVGFEARGAIDVLVALKMQASDVGDFMAPLIAWRPRDNRGLFLDRAQSSEPRVFIPYSPGLEGVEDTLERLRRRL